MDTVDRIPVEELVTYPEIEAAVDWWVNIICGKTPEQISGDESYDALTKAFPRNFKPISLEMRYLFHEYLRVTIAARISQTGWKIDNPNWGSAMRVIHCDYHPDNVLEAAAQRAGIYDLYFRCPIKTNMWINPGEVKVSQGHGAPIEDIYRRG